MLFPSGSLTAIGDIIRKFDFTPKRSKPLKYTLTKARTSKRALVERDDVMGRSLGAEEHISSLRADVTKNLRRE